VTDAPPSLVTLPPQLTADCVTLVIEDVVTDGIVFGGSFLQFIRVIKITKEIPSVRILAEFFIIPILDSSILLN
jgi:hypothetical protein